MDNLEVPVATNNNLGNAQNSSQPKTNLDPYAGAPGGVIRNDLQNPPDTPRSGEKDKSNEDEDDEEEEDEDSEEESS